MLYEQNGNRECHMCEISMGLPFFFLLLSVTNVRPVSLSQVMKDVRIKLSGDHIRMKALEVSPEIAHVFFCVFFFEKRR